jgi:mitogen-activated protein kinase kinase
MKEPSRRPTYSELLEHPFLLQDAERGKGGVDMRGWVVNAIEWREKERIKASATADLGL